MAFEQVNNLTIDNNYISNTGTAKGNTTWGEGIMIYRVTGNFNSDTALIIGMAYRKSGSWVFRAIGKGSRATTVSDLADECVRTCR